MRDPAQAIDRSPAKGLLPVMEGMMSDVQETRMGRIDARLRMGGVTGDDVFAQVAGASPGRFPE